VFNATFSNISAISWRPVLVVEEIGVPGENHRPVENMVFLGKTPIFPYFESPIIFYDTTVF
jgi:hypothetical protein